MGETTADDLFESKVAELRELYHSLRDEMRRKWDRDLPLEELLFDRWERAKHLGFGEGTSIFHNSYVYGKVIVGRETWIGPFTFLDGSGGLEIGDHCNISAGVQIYTHSTVKRAVSGGKAEPERAPVKIGNCCYIAPGVIISKGVTIGDHAVIGASAFVNRDIPAFSVGVGVPCRVTGKVELNEAGEVSITYQERSKRMY